MTRARLNRGLRATFLGMLVNTLLAAGKLAAGLIGHSHALVADAVESLADIFSSVVVWQGLVVAEEPADENHPYGHGKAEPLATAVVAAILILASIWIAISALKGIGGPRQSPAPYTLVVLLAVVLVKEALYRFVQREAAAVDSSAVQADAWHHRSDAITSLAAGIGISIALIGGAGFEAADNLAALLAAGVIAWNGGRLLRPALNELMDTSPHPALIEKITALAAATPGVEQVEKCLVRKMGNQFYVDMHIEVDPQMSVRQAHAIAHAVKGRVRQEQPAVRDVLVHVEPFTRVR